MITLLNDYYVINSQRSTDVETLFDITLLPECCVYAGHFPGNPIAPGVYSIQMIKECAERLAGKQFLLACIEKCKFSAVIKPQTALHLQLRIHLSEIDTTMNAAVGVTTYQVRAVVSDTTTTYIELKGKLISSAEP
jgi:3-hydroxyacyl-[acyl-carrier-protein] dehydratase